jgi:hypothetical protein
MTSRKQRILVIAAAIPVLLFLAFGVMLLVIAKHNRGGDPIVVVMAIAGLGLGLAIATMLLTLIWVLVSHGALRFSVAVIVAAAVFDLVSVPLSRQLSRRVQQEHQTKEPTSRSRQRPYSPP